MEKGTCTYNDVRIFTCRQLFTNILLQKLLHFVAGDEFLRIEGGQRKCNAKRKCEKILSVNSIRRTLDPLTLFLQE